MLCRKGHTCTSVRPCRLQTYKLRAPIAGEVWNHRLKPSTKTACGAWVFHDDFKKTYFLKQDERPRVLTDTEYRNVQLTFQVLFLRDVSLDEDYSVFPIFFGKRQSSIFAILAVQITQWHTLENYNVGIVSYISWLIVFCEADWLNI